MPIFTKRFTPESLRDELQDRLPEEYSYLIDEDGVQVSNDEMFVGFVDLVENGKEVTVAFAADCWPAFAAELAIALNEVIVTYIDVDNGFLTEVPPTTKQEAN